MRWLNFKPEVRALYEFDPYASIAEHAAEPALRSVVGLGAAREQGGNLLRRALEQLGDSYHVPRGLTPVVDTRTQRLMPGMYPSIPGWHCDDWPRATYDSQPDPDAVDPEAYHLTAIIDSKGGGLSETEVLCDELSVYYSPGVDGPLWQAVHKAVESHDVITAPMTAGRLWRFGSHTIHRARPATCRGWRFWMRLSMRHKVPDPGIVNSAEQVYILSEANGW